MLKVPLSQKELDHLAHVISELEKKTSGEIRLMIVRSSVTTGHVPYLLGLTLLSVSLLILWIERHYYIWTADWWLLPAILIGSAVAAILLSPLPIVVRMFTLARDVRRQCLLRAELEFNREGLGATADKTGILLFVSMVEHQAVVLADQGIAKKLNDSMWRDVVAQMLEGPKTGRWAESLEKALRQCGGVLATHFPIQSGDKNELSNAIIVKE